MEVLAPVGTMEGFHEVLAQKPDVIYLGAGDLNARSEDAQLSLEALPELVSEARRQGVRIYFTLNVLVKDSEIPRSLELASLAHEAGVAAVIVQDKGLMRALRENFPALEVHASTQCSVGSREQIRELSALGTSRVVLARELSLAEIRDLTSYAHSLGMDVEVFVQGATCISVSGQCHMSFAIGGRSANRGECAQPCRMRYQLLQGTNVLRENQALLSPKDLSYFTHLKELREAGVDALKIEGRLRSPEYQSQVTAIIKTAVEEIERGLAPSEVITPERERNLMIAFNRGGGYQDAFLTGHRDARFLSSEHVGHQGYELGELSEILPDQGILRYRPRERDYLPSEGSQISLKNEAGTTVATAPVGVVRRAPRKGKSSSEVELKGFHPRVLRGLHFPLTVWQQKQKRVPEQDLRERSHGDKVPVDMTLRREGPDSYALELRTPKKGIHFSSEELEPQPTGTGSPLELSRLAQQLGKLGNTPYEFSSLDITFQQEDSPTWRVSELNAFRRAAIARLEAAPAVNPRAEAPVPESAPLRPRSRHPERPSLQRIINLPNYQAGESLPELHATSDELIVLPLEELSLTLAHDPALSVLREALGDASLGAYLPPLRAWSCELSLDDALRKLADAGLRALVSATSGTAELITELGLDLELYLWQGDQVSNSRSFQFFDERGYEGAMISPELEFPEQLRLTAEFSDAGTRPILLSYGALEAMFTRFCPIGFSRGVDACGLCRRQKGYALKDEVGRVFPLTPRAYADCSLQIWSHEARRDLLTAETDAIRGINFTVESPAEMREILKLARGY